MSRKGLREDQNATHNGPYYQITRTVGLARLAKRFGTITISPVDDMDAECDCACSVSVSLCHQNGELELFRGKVSRLEASSSDIDAEAIRLLVYGKLLTT